MRGTDLRRSLLAMHLSTVASIPLFASVPRRRHWHLARLADEVAVAAGAELTRQGGYAREFFVVVSGTADVHRDGERVGGLGPGDFFGEVGLLAPPLGAQRHRRRHVADAPARPRATPVPRAAVRRAHRRGAHPRRRGSARLGRVPPPTTPRRIISKSRRFHVRRRRAGLDAAELRYHIRAMYRDVAEQPDGDFHFELGRAVAERLGYPAEWLDAVRPRRSPPSRASATCSTWRRSSPGTRCSISGRARAPTPSPPRTSRPAGRVIGVDMTAAQLAKARRLRDGSRPRAHWLR